jgi:hypothetical protein
MLGGEKLDACEIFHKLFSTPVSGCSGAGCEFANRPSAGNRKNHRIPKNSKLSLATRMSARMMVGPLRKTPPFSLFARRPRLI